MNLRVETVSNSLSDELVHFIYQTITMINTGYTLCKIAPLRAQLVKCVLSSSLSSLSFIDSYLLGSYRCMEYIPLMSDQGTDPIN